MSINRAMDKDDVVQIYTMEYSVQFSRSVVSDSWQPHGLQHARLPCPSLLLELAQTHVHQVSDAHQLLNQTVTDLPSTVKSKTATTKKKNG